MGHRPAAHRLAHERLDRERAEAISAVMQALAAPSRLLILDRLRGGPCLVGDLARAVAMEQSAVSQQLRVLRHLRLVVSVRSGRQIFYGLHDSHVAELLDQAISHVEHLELSAAEPLVLPMEAIR